MNHMFTLLRSGVLFCLFVLTQRDATAITYTAIANGNYNSAATWQGGIAPSYGLVNDAVVIPPGIKVTAGANISITGVTGSITINGDLVATNYALHVSDAAMLGNGSIIVDSFSGSFPGQFDFNGTMSTNKLEIDFMMIMGNPTIDVAQVFYVSKSLNLNNGKINLTNGTIMKISGVQGNTVPAYLTVGGAGVLGLLAPYSVEYVGGSIESGVELNGPGLKNVTVDVGTGEEVKLMGNAKLQGGTLKLTSGTFNLNNHNLEFSASGDLDPSGSGEIKGGSSSDITVSSGSAITGELKFTTGSNLVRKFIINTNGSVKLGSDLRITTMVDFQSGKIDVQNHKLSLITGATINGAGSGSYVITGNGGKLADDVGSGDTVTYHVGTQTTYAPCIITSRSNTVYNGLTVGVNDGVKNTGSTGNIISNVQPLVNATWFLENGTATTIDVDVELMWNAGMEVNSFDRTKSYITQLTGAMWDKQAGKAATTSGNMYAMKRENVHSFTPMAVFDNTTVYVNNITGNNSVQLYP
ncbi:MAG: hypothetical protein KDC07_08800, partial [Chitinophagaceae bacterium]|nr:hypothetical protein [Chitinophagaceae bacterium]